MFVKSTTTFARKRLTKLLTWEGLVIRHTYLSLVKSLVLRQIMNMYIFYIFIMTLRFPMYVLNT